jgi:hypothetical protein
MRKFFAAANYACGFRPKRRLLLRMVMTTNTPWTTVTAPNVISFDVRPSDNAADLSQVVLDQGRSPVDGVNANGNYEAVVSSAYFKANKMALGDTFYLFRQWLLKTANNSVLKLSELEGTTKPFSMGKVQVFLTDLTLILTDSCT